eukprot:Pgem_evm1s3327
MVVDVIQKMRKLSLNSQIHLPNKTNFEQTNKSLSNNTLEQHQQPDKNKSFNNINTNKNVNINSLFAAFQNHQKSPTDLERQPEHPYQKPLPPPSPPPSPQQSPILVISVEDDNREENEANNSRNNIFNSNNNNNNNNNMNNNSKFEVTIDTNNNNNNLTLGVITSKGRPKSLGFKADPNHRRALGSVSMELDYGHCLSEDDGYYSESDDSSSEKQTVSCGYKKLTVPKDVKRPRRLSWNSKIAEVSRDRPNISQLEGDEKREVMRMMRLKLTKKSISRRCIQANKSFNMHYELQSDSLIIEGEN